MHLVTESASVPGQPQPIDSGVRHGMTWAVFMESPTSFRFEVRRGGETLFIPGARYKSAGKAGIAAEGWCDDEAGDMREAAAPQKTDDGSGTHAGWTLSVGDDRGGTYRADLLDMDGRSAQEEFRGYQTRELAISHASAWAAAHPCDGSAPPVNEPAAAEVAEPAAALDEHPTEQTDPSVDQSTPIVEELADAETPPLVQAFDELEQLRRENARLQKALALRLADLDEAAVQANEATELKQEIDDLDDQIKALKDEKKAKESRLELVNGKMGRAVKAAAEGTPHTYQRTLPLTFADDAATRTEVAAGAAQVAEQIGPEEYAFNGRTYTIDVEALTTGFKAWLRGYRETEGFGETRAQAVEAAKNRASLVFADMDPGARVATPDAGPVADGPRLPAKRDPKLKGKTADQVVAVVRGCKLLVDAVEQIGCTLGQLRKFETKTGLDFGAELAKDTDLPEPPQQQAKARGRGRKQS